MQRNVGTPRATLSPARVAFCSWSMIFSENRFTLFGIML